MDNKIKIEVWYSENGSFKLFPETSEHLTNKQLIPAKGDGVTLIGNDGVNVLDLNPADTKHIMTVKRRWFNYASSDVAVLVHYEAW